jgi:uncharacterized protein (UPF0333 family)
VVVVVVVIIAFSGHGSNKPNAGGTTAPTASPSATSSASALSQCLAFADNSSVKSVTNQLNNLAKQFQTAITDSNTSEAASIAGQMSQLYAEQAQNVASDPQLSKDISNLSNDMQKLASDISAGNESAVETDGTTLQNDADTVEKLCSGTT